jgi:PIN domain nuclease of toxin-antitoxin system
LINYLLDTHTLIWFLEGDNQLSRKAKNYIETNEKNNFISIASLWEISIKLSIGKLELKKPFSDISKEIFNNGFQILPIVFEDTLHVSELPFHHRDPFDRIIISQCLTNKLLLISKDPAFLDYPIEVIW